MTATISQQITHCRLCGSDRIKPFLDLGKQPPANSLRSSLDEALPFIPLVLCRCDACTTVQLTETVDPAHLFRHYVWVTGTSSTAKAYAQLFCQQALARMTGGRSFAVEVASNDGTFLQVFKQGGLKVLGVDPAQNIAKIANESGVPTWAEFFGEKIAQQVVEKEGAADFVFARNVIPHVAQVHDVVGGMKRCLQPKGVGAIEFHHAKVIVDGLHYDSIYHEHLFYFSIKSVRHLLDLHGLKAFDLIESPISGGSVVLYFTHKDNDRGLSASLKKKIDDEDLFGLDKLAVWEKFAKDCQAHKDKLVGLISAEKKNGATLIGYGASARSSTMLNYCGINGAHLTCVADQNPLKKDKYTAGTDILIVSPEAAFAKKPQAVVLLAWNFKDEILSILKNKHHFSGKVIVPLPNDPYILEVTG